jgi:hypothetical protein
MKSKAIFFIISAALLAIFLASFYFFPREPISFENDDILSLNEPIVENNSIVSEDLTSLTKTVRLEERVLLMVIENNFSLSAEIVSNYQKYKFFVDFLLASTLKVDRKELTDKNLLEIIDVYFEDYLARQFSKAAEGYEEIIVLTDEIASYDNFKQTLSALQDKGKTIDILLHLHGTQDAIYFYNQYVPWVFIAQDLGKDSNIGFVYQTICYSGNYLDNWLNLGAKVASGSLGSNSFVVLSPERFLKLWTKGESYYQAVNQAFDFEVTEWGNIANFVPGDVLKVTDDILEESKLIFEGNKDYVFE